MKNGCSYNLLPILRNYLDPRHYPCQWLNAMQTATKYMRCGRQLYEAKALGLLPGPSTKCMEINLCFTTCLSIVIQQLAEFKKHFYVVNQESVAKSVIFLQFFCLTYTQISIQRRWNICFELKWFRIHVVFVQCCLFLTE